MPSIATEEGSGTVVGGPTGGGGGGITGGGVVVSIGELVWCPPWMNGMKKAGISASGRKRECGPAATMYDGTSSTGSGAAATGAALATWGMGTMVSGSGPMLAGATG